MTATGTGRSTDRTTRPGRPWPWLVALVPAVAWLVHLNVSYGLVPVSCRAGHPWWLVAATLAALAAAGGATATSCRSWGRAGRSPADRTADLAGMLLGALFLLAIAILGLSNVVVDPCW